MEKRPKWVEIADAIRGAIISGDLSPGDRIPRYRQLERDHDASFGPVYMALSHLKHTGWLRGERGRATFVVDDPPIDDQG